MGLQSDILDKLIERIELVKVVNGYSKDIVTINYENIRLNIADYSDYELPAVQIIDVASIIQHEMSRSMTTWQLALEFCLRSTVEGEVNQKDLWNLQEDTIRAIMAKPKLGLSYVVHAKIVDKATDLHLQTPNYIGTIGIEIMYYEPITRDSC